MSSVPVDHCSLPVPSSLVADRDLTGLLRDAEQQLRSALRMMPTVNTYLDLCNVYLRLDVPNTALDLLKEARYRNFVIILIYHGFRTYSLYIFSFFSEKFTIEPRFVLGIARIHDMLNNPEEAINAYKTVLELDSSNVEAIACLGAHCFYTDKV
jgi:tetratricopeptide repeat protein 8